MSKKRLEYAKKVWKAKEHDTEKNLTARAQDAHKHNVNVDSQYTGFKHGKRDTTRILNRLATPSKNKSAYLPSK